MNSMLIQSEAQLPRLSFRNKRALLAEFLAGNGCLYRIAEGEIQINLLTGHPLAGSMQNIYLRVWEGGRPRSLALIGPAGQSELIHDSAWVRWQGTWGRLAYRCTFLLHPGENAWFWQVEVENRSPGQAEVDLIYFQDLGLALREAIRRNEYYNSHYLDRQVFRTEEHGYVLCTRQNQPQQERHPWLMEGALEPTHGFATDALQFYGTRFRVDALPEGLSRRQLPNLRLQGEFTATSLQTHPVMLAPGAKREVVFFCLYEAHHPEATTPGDLSRLPRAAALYGSLGRPGRADAQVNLRQQSRRPENRRVASRQGESRCQESPRPASLGLRRSRFNTCPLLAARDLSPREVEHFFGSELRHREKQQGRLLSFFYRDLHVVLREKEALVDRPHGHIIRSGRDLYPDPPLLSATSFMYGCFSAQLSLGNTLFNQLLSHPRSPFNRLRASGQRIFLDLKGASYLLGVPSAYEMSFAGCRWIYQLDRLRVLVKTWTDPLDPLFHLQLEVEGEQPAAFTISHEISLAVNEYEQQSCLVIDREQKQVLFIPHRDSFLGARYPKARFFLTTPDRDKVERIGGAELLFEVRPEPAEAGLPYLVVKTKPLRRFNLSIGGDLYGCRGIRKRMQARQAAPARDQFFADTTGLATHWKGLLGNPRLYLPSGDQQEAVARINDLLLWNLHNAVIHFTAPRGLEQHNGGAWGLRDVLQGSVECLLTLKQYRAVRAILTTVFSKQFAEDGDWPQWFMFDEYREIQAVVSHGDILLWPIKALVEYLEVTTDFSILEESLPYTRRHSPHKEYTRQKGTVLEHLAAAIKRFKDSFIPGTSLPAYGEGDWDDTLQPLNPELRQRMASGWTVSLAWQYLGKLALLCRGKGALAGRLEGLVRDMEQDYRKYLLEDGVISGFVHLAEDGGVSHLLHPEDKFTGIHYRLLPMTRGIIAGLFSKAEAERHYRLLKAQLLFPDGVRLMDRYLPYHGGVSRYFKRAEQAAYCGREPGLLYIHAHLRAVEAMLKMGDAETAFQALKQVLPINIQRQVPNAQIRQSNCYFSSADPAFVDRYAAQEHLVDLKAGKIPSKGGWRIYSSGPGIFVRLIIDLFLGLRRRGEDLIIDPVIPGELDGLTLELQHNTEKRIQYRYHPGRGSHGVKRVRINGRELPGQALANPYRPGGLRFRSKDFEDRLREGENRVEVWLG